MTAVSDAPSSPTPDADDALLDLPAIVRSCCDAFNADELDGSGDEGGDGGGEGAGGSSGDNDNERYVFARDVFMIGEWFVENSELMAQFFALYQEECERYGLRVCAAVSFWIRYFPSQFDAHPPLCALVNRLRTAATPDQRVDDTLREELDISSIPSYAWLRNVSVRNPVSRHSSLCFEQWSPADLANALEYIDYRVLSRVTISEVKKYVKLSKLRETPILERSIAVFNSISCWVQCMILSKNSPNERADIITKFVNVGKHLRKQANFNTLMAVVGGVTHSNIGRLAKTQALLSSQVKKDLNELTQLLSTSNNFANYRRALREARGCTARIPIMGIHLKDLIAWCNKNNADQFERTARVSRRRIRQLANLLGYFIGVNRIAASLLPDSNMDLINTLKVSFDINYNENDIYDMSVKREPKAGRGASTASASGGSAASGASTPSADTPSVVFADWASGVCRQPDPDIVNKHISAMVDAVFKHYDHDRNEYISRKEFQQIAGNFPYNLDSFVTIDANRDGQISKSEMKAYFLELNKRSSEFRSGFRHNFQETTFLTPTICSHCKKMLWGLIRQGLKCRDCALVVHDACKRLAIAECRRTTVLPWRQQTQSGGSSDDCSPSASAVAGTNSVTAAAAMVGSAAVISASGANFIATTTPAAVASNLTASRGASRNGGGSAPSSSGIAMGGFYDWLVNVSPHHHHHGSASAHLQQRTHSNAENINLLPDEDTNGHVTGTMHRINNRRLRRENVTIDTVTSLPSPKPAHRASPPDFDVNRIDSLTNDAPLCLSASELSVATPASRPTDNSPVTRLIVGDGSDVTAVMSSGASTANLSAIAAEGLSGVRTAFRSSFHRLLRSSKKYRSASETTDNSSDSASPSRMQKRSSHSSNDRSAFTASALTPTTLAATAGVRKLQQQVDTAAEARMQHQASLACEEIFYDDDKLYTSATMPSSARGAIKAAPTKLCRPQRIAIAPPHGCGGAEDRLRRKIESLTRDNEKLRENFRRNSASLSPQDASVRVLSASLPNR